MDESRSRELCTNLIRSDSENEVIGILKSEGLWDDTSFWRYYGDNENNFGVVGNQASSPDAALVEKLVNAIDARLTNECLIREIDPEGPQAPQSMRDAVALFFDSRRADGTAGLISEWLDSKRKEVAKGITLAATGSGPKSGNPCITIADLGEGQSPNAFPMTFLSLSNSNKLRIPFVQGKFNQGGTGALQFCGKHNLQLIVSRRNPRLISPKATNPAESDWGFTVVRRESPAEGRRNSVFTCLAPIDATGDRLHGKVLHFSADKMPIFPQGNKPYEIESEWGSLIKLYEYSLTGFKTHILRKDGLLARLDLLLPNPALPIRLHECRDYRGHKGSFDTTLSGVQVRLDEDKKENIEDGFPATGSLNVSSEQFTTKIYALKKGKADTYRKHEGVVFILNGQTHGSLTADFFRREKVGLSYLVGFNPCSRRL